MPTEQVPGDELLQTGGWSRRTRVAIALGVLGIVVGLVIGLTRAGRHTSSAQHSAAPSTAQPASSAPALTGNQVLSQGTRSTLTIGTDSKHHWVVIAAAELVSNRTVSILYPLSVSGIDNAASVSDVELTAKAGDSSLLPPAPLSTIRRSRHVDVWIKLRIPCSERKVRFGKATVSIALMNTTEPAVFSFADLFGSAAARRMLPC